MTGPTGCGCARRSSALYHISFQHLSISGPAFIIHHSSFILALAGLLREFARKGDAFHDVVMMALLRKERPPAQKLDRPGASVATQKALS